MWPMLIVVDLVLVQDPPQMGLIPYKGAVQEFAAASPDPALGNRVHARRPDVAEHGPDPGVGEDRVEGGGEVRAAVADHEPDPIRVVAEVHDQVTGLLSGPRAGWMRGDAEDADAPGRVLNHGQDIGPGAVKQIGCEEVARQDRLGLGAQELRPGCRGSPRRPACMAMHDRPAPGMRAHAAGSVFVRTGAMTSSSLPEVTDCDGNRLTSRAHSRLIESEVSVAGVAVAFRGPPGLLPNRLPTASAVAVWLYIEVPACRVSPWRGSQEGRAPAP